MVPGTIYSCEQAGNNSFHFNDPRTILHILQDVNNVIPVKSAFPLFRNS